MHFELDAEFDATRRVLCILLEPNCGNERIRAWIVIPHQTQDPSQALNSALYNRGSVPQQPADQPGWGYNSGLDYNCGWYICG